MEDKKTKLYRGYKDPVECYRANYNGLGRFELSKKDSGLYKTLLRCNKLGEAIPRKIKPCLGVKLSEAQINDIISFHYLSDGNAYQTSKKLKYSPSIVIKYWRLKGLEIRKRPVWLDKR